jgi:membrane protease YdiL (CAAX protease family)
VQSRPRAPGDRMTISTTPRRPTFNFRLVRWWDDFFIAPLRDAQRESAAFLASDAGRRPDAKVVAILVSAALFMTGQYYLTRIGPEHSAPLVAMLGRLNLPGAAESVAAFADELGHQGLVHWTYWSLTTAACYFLAPALIVRFAFHERLADYGLKLRGAFADGWIYVVFLSVMVPLIWLASGDLHFQRTYPFFPPPAGTPVAPHLLRWELLYCLQFLAVEFLFRGYLIHGLRRRFGAYCIPIMTVPYCLVHFGKPAPETLGAIAAGLALGFMSLRTRSIFLGAVLHWSVGATMDAMSLWRTGRFG